MGYNTANGQTAENTQELITYTFASGPDMGSGLPSLDGTMVVNTEYNTAPQGTETINSYVLIDGQLIIRPSGEVDYSVVGLSA